MCLAFSKHCIVFVGVSVSVSSVFIGWGIQVFLSMHSHFQ